MILVNPQLITPPILSFFKDNQKPHILVPVIAPNRCSKTVSFRPDPGREGAVRVRMGSGCFGDFPKKKKKKKEELRGVGEAVEIETVSDGVDVMDASMAEAKIYPQHLVIMVNGLVGSASDWKFAADQFVKQLPEKVIVHRSQRNPAQLTFDGVDLMGERLADEVLTVVRNRPKLQKISFIAHSLGGLVARYAIGRLYDPPKKIEPSLTNGNGSGKENSIRMAANLKEDCRGRIAGLEPMNFITVASPHLGSKGHKQLPFLCGLPFLERQAEQTAHLIAGKSGKHLFLTDNVEGRPPLLVRMVSDLYELKFMSVLLFVAKFLPFPPLLKFSNEYEFCSSALRSFKRRVAYANVSYDHVVGWSTSSIRRLYELPKANLLVKEEKYPHIVYTERKTLDDIHHKTSTHIENQAVDFEEEMIRGLNQVPWERVDVSFHKSRQRYVAHNTIQVKSYWLNSDGADVIFHMIDNFVL